MTPAKRKRVERERFARRFEQLLARPGRFWVLTSTREARLLAAGRVPWIVRQQAARALDPAPFRKASR